jgi:glycosyltransferase involved in cell wall biosynthesis
MKKASNNQHFISLIIPAYKQEKILVVNIKQIIKVLNQIRYDFEIIVVLDGDIDNSFEKLKKANLKKVRCFQYQENRGKSYAIRFGMNKAMGDYVMFLDSGMEIDPNGISMLLEHMEWYEADIIVGSKRHPVSRINYTRSRKFLSLGYYFMVKFLFGVGVRDTQAGIKIFKKRVLEKVLPRALEKRFAGDLEMLVIARQLGFRRIYEAPIKLDFEFSKLSSVTNLNAIIGIFIDTLAIFYRAYIVNYYKKIHSRFVEPEKVKSFKFHEKKG